MKSMRILCALAALAARDGRRAGRTLKKIKDSGSITIGHRDASVPFSYYDDKQQPIGYAMDLCMRIVDAVKAELKDAGAQGQLPAGDVGEPHSADGERHDRPRVRLDDEQSRAPGAGVVHDDAFRHRERWVYKKSSNVGKLADLKGKTDRLDRRHHEHQGHDRNQRGEEPRHEHHFGQRPPGRRSRWSRPAARSRSRWTTSCSQPRCAGAQPADYAISAERPRSSPTASCCARTTRRSRQVVDKAMVDTYKSGAINAIYSKWFEKPIPPKNINLNLPMGAAFKKVVANPPTRAIQRLTNRRLNATTGNLGSPFFVEEA
jgi:glutamate/aspartate transport system substrate-binding protein